MRFTFSAEHDNFTQTYTDAFLSYHNALQQKLNPSLSADEEREANAAIQTAVATLSDFGNLIKYAIEEQMAVSAGLIPHHLSGDGDNTGISDSTTPLILLLEIMQGVCGNASISESTFPVPKMNFEAQEWQASKPTIEQKWRMKEIFVSACRVSRPQYTHANEQTVRASIQRTTRQLPAYNLAVDAAYAAIAAYDEDPNNVNTPIEFTQPDDLIKAAINDLAWLAANKDHRPQNNHEIIGPTRALALIHALMNGHTHKRRNKPPLIERGEEAQIIVPDSWRSADNTWAANYDKLRLLADTMTTLAQNATTPEECQQRAKDALPELAPEAPKVQESASVRWRATSFFREMRSRVGQGASVVVNYIPNKYKTLEENVAAAGEIMAERVQEAGAWNAGGMTALFSLHLHICVMAELEKNPQDLYNTLKVRTATTSRDMHQLPPKLYSEIITELGQLLGHNIFEQYFDPGTGERGSFALSSCMSNIQRMREDVERKQGQFASYDDAHKARVLDALFDCETYMRKELIKECKFAIVECAVTGLLTERLTPADREKYEQAIKEQECIVAAREALSSGKNIQLWAAALGLGALGAFGGLALAAGGTAGITAAVSKPAREALAELLNGAPEKFMEGLTMGNPILIMVAVAASLGLVGFVAGYFAAAEAAGRVGGGKEANEIFNKKTAELIPEMIAQSQVGRGTAAR